jgi:hypothetical protein
MEENLPVHAMSLADVRPIPRRLQAVRQLIVKLVPNALQAICHGFDFDQPMIIVKLRISAEASHLILNPTHQLSYATCVPKMVAAMLAPQGGGCVCMDREIDFSWDSTRDLSAGELVTTDKIEGLSAYSPIAWEIKSASMAILFREAFSELYLQHRSSERRQGGFASAPSF